MRYACLFPDNATVKPERYYHNAARVKTVLDNLARARVSSTDLISVQEAAHLLHIRPASVRVAVYEGRLSYVVRGFLDKRDVLDYLERVSKKNHATRSKRLR